VAFGGILVGLVLGYLFQTFSKHYLEPILGVVFSFTIPYVTFIVADLLHVSGVLAVVVNGLVGARILRGHHSSLRRILGYAVWDVLIMLLNCLIFILIGLQVRTIAEKMSTHQILLYTGYALLITLVMVIVRFIWVYTRSIYSYINALRHRHATEHCAQILKESAIVSWAGMRGIVSLAIALALPFKLPNGMPLEGRNEVVFITFMVILITLVIPGLTLPSLIRWLKLTPVDKDSMEQSIRSQLAQHADGLISSFLATKVINQKEYRFLKSYFRSQHKVLELAHMEESSLSGLELARREIIHSQRHKLIEIWKQHQIDDKVLNHLENELDMLETHIARGNLQE
jgi:CPA1 family monovalent cation:H+ antiporter